MNKGIAGRKIFSVRSLVYLADPYSTGTVTVASAEEEEKKLFPVSEVTAKNYNFFVLELEKSHFRIICFLISPP